MTNPKMTHEQVKAMLRRVLDDQYDRKECAICCDDPYVGLWVEWEVLDKFIDREFAKL